jgi:hypothetical protein
MKFIGVELMLGSFFIRTATRHFKPGVRGGLVENAEEECRDVNVDDESDKVVRDLDEWACSEGRVNV